MANISLREKDVIAIAVQPEDESCLIFSPDRRVIRDTFFEAIAEASIRALSEGKGVLILPQSVEALRRFVGSDGSGDGPIDDSEA